MTAPPAVLNPAMMASCEPGNNGACFCSPFNTATLQLCCQRTFFNALPHTKNMLVSIGRRMSATSSFQHGINGFGISQGGHGHAHGLVASCKGAESAAIV
jgi:hypothetical protein